MRRIALPALAVLALAAAGGPAHAQEDQQLETVQQQIESGEANAARISGEIAEAVRQQDEVAARLAAVAQAIQAQEASVAGSEDELRKMAGQRVAILAELGEKQDLLSDLLAGLQQMEQNPPPALVVKPDDILAALRGAMLLGTIVPELDGEAKALSAKLDELKQIEARIVEGKRQVETEVGKLKAARADLSGLIAVKQALVSKGNADLDGERRRIAQLADRARSIKQLLASLADERARAETEAADRKAAEERARKRQEELLRQPKIAFADARGKLAFPAKGEVVHRYGDTDGLGGQTRGVMLATSAGAQVTTPADGKVEFAGPFRSYGQVVILNPGGGYRVLLAGMDKVTANVGEFLRAGEPVGEMGTGPASVTLFGEVVPDGRPVLYIEFRDGTEAIDSGPWWIGGLKEARG